MKKVKKILIITLFAFMLFNIDNFSVKAAQNWGSYSSDAINSLGDKDYCKYTMSSVQNDGASYTNKEIILVAGTDENGQGTIYYLSPDGKLLGNAQDWASDQMVTFQPYEMYRYLYEDGSLNCKGLAFVADGNNGEGNLTIYDPNTATKAHANVQLDIFGDAITKKNRKEMKEKVSESEQGETNSNATKPETEEEVVTCEGILGENVREDIDRYLGYIKIAAPIIVIVLGMVDFSRAVIAGDDKEFGKAVSSLTKRLIAAIALFFIPIILNYLIGAVSMFADHQINGCHIGGLR